MITFSSSNLCVVSKQRMKSIFRFSLEKDEKAPRYAHKVWRSTVISPNFDETNSRSRFDVSEEEFDLTPGEYYVIATLIDLESKRKSDAHASLSVPNYNRPQIQLGDLLLAKRIRLAADGMYEIVPNVDRVVRNTAAPLYVYYEVYPKSSEKLDVYSRILNSNGEVIYDSTYSLKAVDPVTRDYLTLDLSTFTHGLFVFELQVSDGENTALRSTNFKILLAGLPSTVRDLDEAIQQLRYIAQGKELREIEKAPLYKVEELFRGFWKKRDPTPGTSRNELMEEYYRRIEEANQKFGSFRDGWETDMGEVYVRFGPPSEIERHPFDINMKPYEIWRYHNLKRQFVFVDENGYGEYRLVTNLW